MILLTIYSGVLLLFKSFVPWCKLILFGGEGHCKHPLTWLIMPFVVAPSTDFMNTWDFICLFSLRHPTCLIMESLTIRFFSPVIIMVATVAIRFALCCFLLIVFFIDPYLSDIFKDIFLWWCFVTKLTCFNVRGAVSCRI